MNALTNGREAINTNVASTCGVIVRVTNRGRISGARRDTDGLLYVDTLAVLVDFREAAKRLASGVEFCPGRHGLEYSERLLAATKAAIIANAENSWSRMRYVSITVTGGRSSQNRTDVVRVPKRSLSRSY